MGSSAVSKRKGQKRGQGVLKKGLSTYNYAEISFSEQNDVIFRESGNDFGFAE